MLEQLMGLIKENSQEAIVNNPVIPNEHNDSAMQTILASVVGGLANQGQSGNTSGLMGLLTGQSSNLGSNPIVSGIATQAIGSLMQKFGINNSAASGIVSAVLPSVIGQLVSKTNDPNDSSFDLGSIMGAITGGGQPQSGGAGGVMDMIGGLLGGAQQQPQAQPQGGGLMDMLNVFLKSQQK